MVKNAALSRALRSKDQEMNQLILMVRAPACITSDMSQASAACVHSDLCTALPCSHDAVAHRSLVGP